MPELKAAFFFLARQAALPTVRQMIVAHRRRTFCHKLINRLRRATLWPQKSRVNFISIVDQNLMATLVCGKFMWGTEIRAEAWICKNFVRRMHIY